MTGAQMLQQQNQERGRGLRQSYKEGGGVITAGVHVGVYETGNKQNPNWANEQMDVARSAFIAPASRTGNSQELDVGSRVKQAKD